MTEAPAPAHFQVATTGRRVAGALIDLVPLTGLVFALATAAGTLKTSDGFSVRLDNGWFLLDVLITYAYYIGTELLWGATPGKLLVGTRVVDEAGHKPSGGRVVARNLMRIVDGLPFFYLVGFVSSIANERNGRLGDLVASTVVVRR